MTGSLNFDGMLFAPASMTVDELHTFIPARLVILPLSVLGIILVRLITVYFPSKLWPKDALSKRHTTTSNIPHVHHIIPYIGHVLSLQRQSAKYVHGLMLGAASPLFSINIMSRRVIIANPAMDKALAKHTKDTGLAQVMSVIGASIFSLSQMTIDNISENDPRAQHQEEFLDHTRLKKLIDVSQSYAAEKVQRSEAQQVELSAWVFNLTVQATAAAIWGPENPWNGDDKEFTAKFM